MRALPFILVLAAFATSAIAQTPLIEKSTEPATKFDQKAERIHNEDASNKIDELKVGGETKSVTVQPKNSSMPEYEILPPARNRAGAVGRDGSEGTQQPRVWNIMKF